MCHQVKSELFQRGFGIRMLSIGIDINYFCAAWHMLGHYFYNNSTRVAQAIISAAITIIMIILIIVIRSVLRSAPLSRALHAPALSSPLCPPQEVPFSRVWCSNRQPLHCAFSLERYTPTTTQLSCKICIRQLKGHEQILQVQTSILEVSPWCPGHLTCF